VSARSAIATFRGHREPHFRIIDHRKWWFLLSGSLIVICIVAIAVRGFNLSIDFKGGSQLVYPNQSGATVSQVQGTLAHAPWNLAGAEVQIVGGNQISVRTSSLTELTDVQRTQLIDALAKQAGVTSSDISRTDIGPSWGSEISRKALEGLIIVLIAISIYIAFRFEWKMAVGAQVAMLHDVIITAGVYALTGREVTPATVIAILTILGYSLYDTVVIYDRIKENTESPAMLAKDTYSGVVNTSLNQVFMRSVNTSLVVIIPILSLLLFGGATLKDFAFAMLIGVVSGAYSSIFVAAPILSLLKEREPKYAQIRARATARETTGRRLQPVPAGGGSRGGDGQASVTTLGPTAATGAVPAPTARSGQGQGRSSSSTPRSRQKPKKKKRRR
jgi:preprotein translocase subunit SecF